MRKMGGLKVDGPYDFLTCKQTIYPSRGCLGGKEGKLPQKKAGKRGGNNRDS